MVLTGLDVAFVAGEGVLTLTSADGQVVIRSHWLNDRFAELVSCVDQLASGAEVVSCRWQGPINDGHFIDFVADPAAGLSLAIHEFSYPDGITAEEIWSAERGPAVLVCHQPLQGFVVLFASAVRRVRATAVDVDGLIEQYPRPFPFALFEQMERSAARMGYQPTPVIELGESQSAPMAGSPPVEREDS